MHPQQIEDEFKRQVFLCAGIGYKRALSILNSHFKIEPNPSDDLIRDKAEKIYPNRDDLSFEHPINCNLDGLQSAFENGAKLMRDGAI